MLRLINEDRSSFGLEPVAWETTAAAAGKGHALEMAKHGYLSHWNLAGQGPDYRYSLAGGLDNSRENVFMYWHSPGAGPTTQTDWEEIISQAEKALMDSSGHRENILSPQHTHVGIGIAHNPVSGQIRIAQEFVDRYVRLQPLPQEARIGQEVIIRGNLGSNASHPVVNLAYEPQPSVMTAEELNLTGTYVSRATNYDVSELSTDGNGYFEHTLRFDNEGQPGLYHVRIWVDTAFGRIMANDLIVRVR